MAVHDHTLSAIPIFDTYWSVEKESRQKEELFLCLKHQNWITTSATLLQRVAKLPSFFVHILSGSHGEHLVCEVWEQMEWNNVEFCNTKILDFNPDLIFVVWVWFNFKTNYIFVVWGWSLFNLNIIVEPGSTSIIMISWYAVIPSERCSIRPIYRKGFT